MSVLYRKLFKGFQQQKPGDRPLIIALENHL
jgi:hypothetical protein